MLQTENTLVARIRAAITAAAAKLRPARTAPAPELVAPPRYPWEDSYPDGIDWRAEIPIAPVTDLLDSAAAEFPDNPCLEFMGKRYDYKTVANRVNRIAKGLQDMGIGPG
ncbi:MAG: hypothetical protein PVG24_12300, partial [Gammaproteobacteria bacterium]